MGLLGLLPPREMCQCGGAAGHEHGLVPETPQKRSLHPYVDFPGVACLNVTQSSDIAQVLRAKFEDLPQRALQSDTDQQILVKIRFAGVVKLKSILLHSQAEDSAPAEMQAFVNMPELDFSSAGAKPASQSWSLVSPSSITADPIEYPAKYARHQG